MPKNKLQDLAREFLKYDTFSERLGLIERDVTPTEISAFKKQAAQGNLGKLYEVYEKMELDSRVGGVVNTLKSAITKVPLKLNPAEAKNEGDKKIALQYHEVVTEAFADIDLHNMTREFSEAYLVGANVYELVYDYGKLKYSRDLLKLKKIKQINVQALGFDNKPQSNTRGELLVFTEKNPDGIAISKLSPHGEKKFFVHEDGNGEGKYDIRGVMRKCLDWYMIKVYARQWWAEYAEIYGEPIRIGKYPEGTQEDERALMETFLASLGKHAYGLFPSQMQLQLIEANRQGTITTYHDLIEYANTEITIAVIGQTQTTDGGRNGSYAKAEIHDMVKHDILQHVATVVEKAYNKVTEQVLKVNFGDSYNKKLAPKWVILIPSPHNLTEKASVFTSAVALAPVSMEHIFKELGLPKPKAGEMVVFKNRIFEYSDEEMLKIIKEEVENAKKAANSQGAVPSRSGNANAKQSGAKADRKKNGGANSSKNKGEK